MQYFPFKTTAEMLLIYLKAVSENFVAFPPLSWRPNRLSAPPSSSHARRKGGRPRLDSQRGPHYPPTQPPTVPTVQYNEGGILPFFLLYTEADCRGRKQQKPPTAFLLLLLAIHTIFAAAIIFFHSEGRAPTDARCQNLNGFERRLCRRAHLKKKPSAHLSKIAEQEAHFPPLLYVFPPTVNPERRSETFFHARACNQVARKATSKLGEETLQ